MNFRSLMGHEFGNLIGISETGLDKTIRKLAPGYMTMEATGMGDMGDMGMKVPANSLPMIGGPRQYDYITMGGMFTILKVRDSLPADGSDPGWFKSPPGIVFQLLMSTVTIIEDGLMLAMAVIMLLQS
ncbi:MAG: hypothetical protein ACKVY0_19730 [Prosthecobacter sp.]|uniref:hypothetical protein n=1 Tax=Prosthecobacter sp. TaxID=1965333 RepID=UPI0039018152